jgi:hypothetical protein
VPPPTRRKRLVRGVVNFAALTVGAAAAVAQLLGLTRGWGQVVLTGVGVACLLYLAFRWFLLFYRERAEELAAVIADLEQRLDDEATRHRSQLAELQVGHQQYHDAIRHVVDQSRSVCRERLEMTVVVGTDDGGDLVIERHHTEPTFPLPHRAFRPIVPTGGTITPPLDMRDINLQTRVLDQQWQMTALPLVNQSPLRIWLIFKPSMHGVTDWEVEYRPRGLWAPLRESGIDKLVWTDRPPLGNGGSSILDELVVRFVFPRSGKAPSVKELYSQGEMREPIVMDGSGAWLIEFCDPSPAGRRYEWELARQVAAAA